MGIAHQYEFQTQLAVTCMTKFNLVPVEGWSLERTLIAMNIHDSLSKI